MDHAGTVAQAGARGAVMLFKASAILNLGLGLAAVLLFQWWQGAKQELEYTQLDLYACGGRLINVLEDRNSDTAIDSIDDLRDFVVPPGWLLPPDAGDAGP